MEKNKSKILGQFFSGERIPKLLYSFLCLNDIHNVIDPMCGSGDMFAPFGNSIAKTGIEIDSVASKISASRFSDATIYTGNAFSPDVLKKVISHTGYDLVITNPPFVRRELINPKTSNGYHKDFVTIKKWLIYILSFIKYIPEEEKLLIRDCIDKFSNISDLSIPALILCLMLIRPGGQLALVLPTTWLSREYARPVKILLSELCNINNIVIDSNRVWFKDSAQVQTSLIIARRKYFGVTYINHRVRYVNLFALSSNSDSLVGAIPPQIDFYDLLSKNESAIPFFEIRSIPQSEIFEDNSNSLSQKSKLSPFYDEKADTLTNLESLGINVGQGLRTGANPFFYFKREGEYCLSSISSSPIKFNPQYFIPVIRSQDCLTDSYSITDAPVDMTLYIQNHVLPEDIGKIHTILKPYGILEEDVTAYVREAQSYLINDRPIPQLSAVKTNITKGVKDKVPRFWYMLPHAKKRHYANVFIPRIISFIPKARINIIKSPIFIDANFTNFWLETSSPFTNKSLFAMLNSRWTLIQFEELGSTMGGGALKLDAVQIKKCLFPTNITSRVEILDALGDELIKSPANMSSNIIDKIDSVILDCLNLDKNSIAILSEIHKRYLLCRI